LRQQRRSFQALKSTIADHPAHDSTVLLLDECLVLLAVEPTARETEGVRPCSASTSTTRSQPIRHPYNHLRSATRVCHVAFG
jgi:hypothetical protein